MRALLVLALSALLAACASLSADDETACPDPRPQVCTLEYNPTCAVLVGGEQKEYSSPCNACADDQVATVLNGPCPE